MKRKVVKHGPSTFIISLPAKWVKEYSIQKGESLEVQIQGRKLVVSRDSAELAGTLARDISNLTPELGIEFVMRAYRQGYDKLLLDHHNVEFLHQLQETLPQLLGFVITQQDEDTCTIQSISRDIELSFDDSLQNAFTTLQRMLEAARESYVEQDKDGLRALALTAQDVCKLSNFCFRQLNTGHKKFDEQLRPEMYCLLEELQDLATDIEFLGQHLSTVDQDSGVEEMLGKLIEQFSAAKAFATEATVEHANTLLDESRALRDLSLENGKPEQRMVRQALMRIGRRVRHLAGAHVPLEQRPLEGGETEQHAEAAA